MRPILALLLLLPLPALAQLQFDTAPVPTAAAPINPLDMPAGIEWLQNKPMTLFDLGLMEMSNAANIVGPGVVGVRGGVAEFQADKGLIAVSFYAGLPYGQDTCLRLVSELRDKMFLQRQDRERLERELSSYFISYGPPDPTRPRNIGFELVRMTRVTAYMQGGACQLPLTSDEAEYWQDAQPPQLPPPAPPEPPHPAQPRAR